LKFYEMRRMVSRPRRDRDIGVTVSRLNRDVQKSHRNRLETETFETDYNPTKSIAYKAYRQRLIA